MQALAIEVFGSDGSSRFMRLDDETEITITVSSPVFGTGDIWSFPFTVNVYANAGIFGSSGTIHGDHLHDVIHRRRARLWVEGLPLYYGVLLLDDEVSVSNSGDVDLRFEGGHKSFDDIIDNINARQVRLLNDVPIGMALWRHRPFRAVLGLRIGVEFTDGRSTVDGTPVVGSGHKEKSEVVYLSINEDAEDAMVQRYPKFVMPHGSFLNMASGVNETIGEYGGGVTTINTDYPYDDSAPEAHPYCNVQIAYQRKGYPLKADKTVDYEGEIEAKRGYEVCPALRTNPAPCFYVMYWIRCLFAQLGILIEENQMQGVEDLRRLFFFNTNCAYEEPDTLDEDDKYGKYTSTNYLPEDMWTEWPLMQYNTDDNGDKLTDIAATINSVTRLDQGELYDVGSLEDVEVDNITFRKGSTTAKWKQEYFSKLTFGIADSDLGRLLASSKSAYQNRYWHKAYASSDCFPDIEVSTIIKSLEDGFGVRFVFDDDYKHVRIMLLRDILLNPSVQEIGGETIDTTKVENNIRGFRLRYSSGDDSAFKYPLFEQQRDEERNPYGWLTPSDGYDYSKLYTSTYRELLQQVSSFNNATYYTPVNGNAYTIKIDKNFKHVTDMHPSVFEVGGFIAAEDGDCTGEESTIKDIQIGFTPLVMTDVQEREHRRAGDDRAQVFAAFVDEDMRERRYQRDGRPSGGGDFNNDPAMVYPANGRAEDSNKAMSVPGVFYAATDAYISPREIEFEVKRPIYSGSDDYIRWRINATIEGFVTEGYRLYLQDNFEPNDEGVAPIETHDCGLTLGIMRGSGNDARVRYWLDADEGEGNDSWGVVPGSSATAHADTCDNYGNQFDYNGQGSISTPEDAVDELSVQFPDSNYVLDGSKRVTGALIANIRDSAGLHRVLMVYSDTTGMLLYPVEMYTYPAELEELCATENISILEADSRLRNLVVEVDSVNGRVNTLLALQRAKQGVSQPIIIDNGVGAEGSRFSLKPRVEKPNPYFDASIPEDEENNPRFLPITNASLRKRGLADTFYKEYSYWERNARIVKKQRKMELADFLRLDLTRRANVDDVTGFIKKMQLKVSVKNGLGIVEMEVMYI